MQLQQRVAGLLPRAELTRLYQDGRVDGPEFLTVLLASGWDETAAQSALRKAHADGGPAGWPDPAKEVIEPDLPQYSLPRRVARRPGRKANELRGHPLDG